MNEEAAKKLREPFPEAVIGKLPRVTCRACSDRNTNCQDHRKQKCGECGNFISTAHMHLDYVGHAAVTDRLLQVDPEWFWEPVATDPTTGAPVMSDYGLWIKLTVCGTTRYGWGDGKNIKEMISDAIRNAAMRFGVALDLWAKEDLNAMHDAPVGAVVAEAGPIGTPTRDVTDARPGKGESTPPVATLDPVAESGSPGEDAVQPAAAKPLPAEYATLTAEDIDKMPGSKLSKLLLALNATDASGTLDALRARAKRELGL